MLKALYNLLLGRVNKKIIRKLRGFVFGRIYTLQSLLHEGPKIVCFDLDGVVTEIDSVPVNAEEYYSEVLLKEGAKRFLDDIKEKGWFVVLFTARLSYTEEITRNWLKKHQIPYDVIIFNKPFARYYVDDRAVEFKSWQDLERRGIF